VKILFFFSSSIYRETIAENEGGQSQPGSLWRKIMYELLPIIGN
jgi:hypothetical protein